MSGHQILKAREGYTRAVPDWVSDDTKFKAILFASFPQMFENKAQRQRASRWASIFYLYYRGNYTNGDISKVLGITINAVNLTLHKIRLAAAGKTHHGKLRGVRPRGRPKKIGESVRTSMGSSISDISEAQSDLASPVPTFRNGSHE